MPTQMNISHSPSEARPFRGLSPDVVVAAIEYEGYRCDGRVLALGSYENRVYQVGIEGMAPIVAKFYRPGRWSDAAILEEHAFATQLSQAEVPVVPPLRIEGRTLFRYQEFRFGLYPRCGGRWPELATAEDRERMGRLLGRLHAVGAADVFRHRPKMSIESLGGESARFLLGSGFVPDYLRARFGQVVDELLGVIVQRCEEVGRWREIRLHGDCHRGNVLWTEDGPHFVDLDDCMTGPVVQDLWMLLAGTPDEMRAQLEEILSGYRRFARFDDREIGLIEPLRGLRLLHYNAWVGRRWHDPAFPLAFPWFAEPRYWESFIVSLGEQIATLECDTLR